MSGRDHVTVGMASVTTRPLPSASSMASPRRYIAAVSSGASRWREAPFVRGFVSFGSVDEETSCLPFQKSPEPCAPVHPGRWMGRPNRVDGLCRSGGRRAAERPVQWDAVSVCKARSECLSWGFGSKYGPTGRSTTAFASEAPRNAKGRSSMDAWTASGLIWAAFRGGRAAKGRRLYPKSQSGRVRRQPATASYVPCPF